jgi:tRNA threonylcarbamoyladenosine biosynthesis protein TsaE
MAMSAPTRLVAGSPEETEEIGCRLGLRLEPGRVVSLSGKLGCGKTTLVKGIARALGVQGPITSPSFTLISEYRGQVGGRELPLHHIDLYRLESLQELEDIGLSEILEGEGVSLIEWGEKAALLLPPGTVRVQMRILSDGRRSITIHGAPP